MAQENSLKPIAEEDELTMASHHVSELKIWNFFMGIFQGNEYACAGAMGNMQWESGCYSDNAENLWNNTFHISDETLTSQINDGTIDLNTFLQRSWWVNAYGFGYGLSQWTDTTRRTELWNRTIGRGYDIDDENAQLDYIEWEWTNPNSHYNQFLSGMLNAQSVYEATKYYLDNYEVGAWNDKRLEFATYYYNTYGTGATPSIQILVIGDGTATVSNKTPQAGDLVTLTCIPNSGESLVDIDIREIATGYAVACSVVQVQTIPFTGNSWFITVTFTGQTPPDPDPPPIPPFMQRNEHRLKIWEYPIFTKRRK